MAGSLRGADARVVRRTCQFGATLLTNLGLDDFEGRPRRLPGQGFAVRVGTWPFALRAAVETRRRPAWLGRLQTRLLETTAGPLWVRASSAAVPAEMAGPGPRRDRLEPLSDAVRGGSGDG